MYRETETMINIRTQKKQVFCPFHFDNMEHSKKFPKIVPNPELGLPTTLSGGVENVLFGPVEVCV